MIKKLTWNDHFTMLLVGMVVVGAVTAIVTLLIGFMDIIGVRRAFYTVICILLYAVFSYCVGLGIYMQKPKIMEGIGD